ncbi:MAG: cryptochrome/photolyase family protein [Calditrichota bacterium]
MPVSVADTEHFLTERNELAKLFEGKKSYLMETFYREMRMKHNIMVDEQMKPEGGKWNYDAENRKKWKGDPAIPDFPLRAHNVSDLLQDIQNAGVETFGEVDAENFAWPISRSESRKVLEHFAKNLLPYFGKYQDAMHTEQRFLFHSRLSFAMNSKMLDPLEVVKRVIEEWRKRPTEIDIAQVEGFVRQIIGWREYMRGVYWAHMPSYAELNFFEHDLPLPEFYWTGDTKMNCLKHSIKQSLEEAYAHHIQRLMITGNFALLLGVHPDAVDNWYLGIYIDALEWVEITNTRGMSQFADGGIVGTKPYISAANYVNKMSNYCIGCDYERSKRVGDDACPFNALYWNFLDRHREKLAKNHRMSMMFRLVDKMPPEERQAIASRATEIRKNPDAY